MTFTIIFIAFCALCLSHAAFLCIGWLMAIKADSRLQFSKPDKRIDSPGDIMDEIDKARLDYE